MPYAYRLLTCSVLLFSLLLHHPILHADAADDTQWQQDKAKFLEASRREWDHRIANWQEVAAWNFDDGRIPDAFRIFKGEWRVVDGQLSAVDGKPDDNRSISIANCQWPAFRLEFDATLTAREGAPADRIGDIGVSLNADPETGSFNRGYVFIAAQYFNQATVFYRLNVPAARTEWSPIVPGQRHRIMLEVVKAHLRFWIDGRVVLDAWERTGQNNRDTSDFLDMDPERVIALHTYDSILTIDNLKISIPAEP